MLQKSLNIPYKLRNGRDVVRNIPFTPYAQGTSAPSTGGVTLLAQLQDVEITNLTDNDFFVYSQSQLMWVNASRSSFLADYTRRNIAEEIQQTWSFLEGLNISRNKSLLYDNVPIIQFDWNATYGVDGIKIGQNAGLNQATGLTGVINIGRNAGQSNSGSHQIAIGAYSGTDNIGFSQIAIGYYTGRYNSGNNNISIGSYANYYTEVDNCIAIGNNAGYENIYTSNMISIGNNAGYQAGLEAGSIDNVFIGNYAGYQSFYGNNIAIGSQAGRGNAGQNNIFIGDTAGQNNVSSNQFIVKHGANPSLIRGDFYTRRVILPTLNLEYLASSQSYTSGILGTGTMWHMSDGNGLSFLEVDNLRVRNELRAHIFKKDIVKASNGYLFVTDAAEIAEDTFIISTSSTFKIVDDGTNATFNNGDLLWCKNISDDGSLQINGVQLTVGNQIGTGITNGKNWIEYSITSFRYGGDMFAGDTIVRISDGHILLDASSQHSPFIDINDQIATWGDFDSKASLKIRLGNLSGIADVDFPTISGYGLYGENVYLKGEIVVTGGNAATTTYADTVAGNAQTNAIAYIDSEIGNLGNLAFQNAVSAAMLDTTVIQGGLILTSLIDANWIKSDVITTNYIEGLTLNFVQGTIGDFTISQNSIWANNSQKFIGLSNSETVSPDNANRIRRGLTIFNDDSIIGTNGFKLARFGALTNIDTNTWPATVNYGIQIQQRINSVNKDIFRIDKDGALLAGINFDDSRLWTTNWEINKDGSVLFTKGQLGGFVIGNSYLRHEDINNNVFALYAHDGYTAYFSGDGYRTAGIGNLAPATFGNNILGYFKNTRPAGVGTENYGIFLDIKGGGDNQSLYSQNGYNQAIRVFSGDIRIDQGNVRTYSDWKYILVFDGAQQLLDIGHALKFRVRSEGNATNYVVLPDSGSIYNQIGKLGYQCDFDIIIKSDRVSTRQVRVRANGTNNIYDHNANPQSYFELGPGDAWSFYWDGAQWNTLMARY